MAKTETEEKKLDPNEDQGTVGKDAKHVIEYGFFFIIMPLFHIYFTSSLLKKKSFRSSLSLVNVPCSGQPNKMWTMNTAFPRVRPALSLITGWPTLSSRGWTSSRVS